MGNQSKTVLVALSGGIDSTAAALLLKSRGYNVRGIHFVFYYEPESCAPIHSEFEKLAIKLDIPVEVVDVRSQFNTKIIKPFLENYRQGITPFPCALCNKTLKWPLLISYAALYGCNYVATGHYAQIVERGKLKLISPAADSDKDQSFFLWGIRQTWMDKILFPLATKHKTEVKAYLSENGFSEMSIQKESLSICFAESNYKAFIKRHTSKSELEILKGEFIDQDGNILGRHSGIQNYTVGQRRGLDINLEGPLYVTHIDPISKTVTLGKHELLYKSSFHIIDYYFAPGFGIFDKQFDIKIRYRKQLSQGRLEPTEETNRLKVILKEPEYAIAKGQTAVFMLENMIVGGGFIA